MRKKCLLNQIVCVLIMSILMLLATSCGTLLYPERSGQTRGRIDPAVAIMDGVGLLLFLVPGVIAFIVDFSTGAIYLPPGSSDIRPEKSPEALVMIRVDVSQLDKKCIETLLNENAGISIDVCDENVKVTRLEGPGASKEAEAWLLSYKTSVQPTNPFDFK